MQEKAILSVTTAKAQKRLALKLEKKNNGDESDAEDAMSDEDVVDDADIMQDKRNSSYLLLPLMKSIYSNADRYWNCNDLEVNPDVLMTLPSPSPPQKNIFLSSQSVVRPWLPQVNLPSIYAMKQTRR